MDKRKIKYAVERYGVTEFNVVEEPYFDYQRFDSFSSPYGEHAYTKYRSRPNVTLKMPLENFDRLLNSAEELDDLLSDRETRELINQARFIYKLRYGTTF